MNRRRLSSAADSCSVSRSDRCCSSSVVRQNSTTPTQAASTATPWMSDQVQGRCCAAGWLNIRSGTRLDPIPWLSTVNTMFSRNGTQSW